MGEGRKRKLSVAVERAVADEAALVLDTFGGKLHVKFDHATSVTMLGQLPFFVEFLQTSGLYDRSITSAALVYSSPNAPRFTAAPPVTHMVADLTGRAATECAQFVAAHRDELLTPSVRP